jgi:type IV pilus assembly protein PilQ
MYNRRITSHLAIFFAFCMLITFSLKEVHADQNDTKFILNDVTSNILTDSMTVTLKGSMAPAYTSRELYDPYRLIVDIAEVEFAKNLQLSSLIPDNKFANLQTTVVRGLEPEITRFIFTINEGYRQKVERDQNDVIISFLPVTGAEKQPSANIVAAQVDSNGLKPNDSAAGNKIRELIESTAQSVNENEKSLSPGDELVQNFDFAGYKRERISIDFYKIDLHNVFRLFRQVSGLNLIVAEGVSGSLTLALNDVPWDFALDIILNLADLEKEERFNTVIIYPKSKAFEWPERAADNLSFEANLEVVEQEALIIEQSAKQPKEIMQAKELMRKALMEEKNKNYEDAVQLYEQAAELWPSNAKLTSKLAALYLVRMGMSAKGVFYAQKSLEVQPDNYNAALYAAIGMANMNKTQEAVEYFSRSISGTPPMKEALASFAAYSENNGRQQAALKLYDKYHEIYGQTVDTMVAKARIFDNLGMTEKATDQYESVLNSGFPLNLGLKKYIQDRLSEANK